MCELWWGCSGKAVASSLALTHTNTYTHIDTHMHTHELANWRAGAGRVSAFAGWSWSDHSCCWRLALGASSPTLPCNRERASVCHHYPSNPLPQPSIQGTYGHGCICVPVTEPTNSADKIKSFPAGRDDVCSVFVSLYVCVLSPLQHQVFFRFLKLKRWLIGLLWRHYLGFPQLLIKRESNWLNYTYGLNV